MFCRSVSWTLFTNVLFTGTGFHTRDRHEQDVDDEVDIDGDDQAFGDAQFTEGDILPVDHPQPAVEQDVEVEIEGDSEDEAQREQKTLHDLVAEGKVVRRAVSNDGLNAVKEKMDEVMGVGDADKMDLAILAARKRGDKSSLITALKNKVKQLVSLIPPILQRAKSQQFTGFSLGIHACIIIHLITMPDMPRPIQ